MFEKVDVLIMQNTVNLRKKTNQKMTFDIKGSTYHRTAHFNDKWWLKQASFEGHKKVMKCQNFVQINEDFNQTLI